MRCSAFDGGVRGLLLWVLLAGTSCSDGRTGPVDDDSGPLLDGTVHAVGGGSVEGLWAVWRSGGTADSARISGNGAFEVRASAGALRGELLIDGPEPRSVTPFSCPSTPGT